ncbi:MAG: hypothetical protein AAB268_09620 [Elusimicrobiota bacterium]
MKIVGVRCLSLILVAGLCAPARGFEPELSAEQAGMSFARLENFSPPKAVRIESTPKIDAAPLFKDNPLQEFGLTSVDTPYDVLAKMFAKGRAPSREEVTGWHAGRMYAANTPHKPVAALLASVKDAANGPAFPDFKIVTDWDSNINPDGWDTLSPAKVLDIKGIIQRTLANFTFPVFAPGEITFESQPSNRYKVRKSGDYLVVRCDLYDGSTSYAYHYKDVTPAAQ